ncbi:hypothetical protein ILYODFUR_000059 [Ilyodon furcidens]|uniref:Prolactin receptor n=1 Tax=Ilyodon furcidens TaxID=33524 RepID=A0ABV0TF50_9TELE
MEMKIHRLEVNVEVNAGYGNETTLSVILNSDKPDRQLTITTKKQNADVNESKPTNSPPWTSLGAKPKHKSLSSDLGKQLTEGTLHLDESAWQFRQTSLEHQHQGENCSPDKT